MSEIEKIHEKIQRYIARTEINEPGRYELDLLDAKAIRNMGDMLDAVYTAFLYGRAKGYRAAKAERKAVTK